MMQEFVQMADKMGDWIEIGVGLTCVLFFGACLIMTTFFWDKAQANARKAGYHVPRFIGIVGALALMAVGGGIALHGYSNYQTSLFTNIDSIEKAQKYVLGTWTYTDPLDPETPDFIEWEKWVIKDGGVMECYSARPDADSWGSPTQRRYKIITQKFIDTGERFYAIEVLDTAQRAIIRPGNLWYTVIGSQGGVFMRPGDKNPFSK